MSSLVLNVELVEGIQQMLSRGKDLSAVLDGLTSATLAGLLEYSCLQHGEPDRVPSLPVAIQQSPLGVALGLGPSLFDRQANIGAAHSVNDLRPRPVELSLIQSGENLDESIQWQTFLGRFEMSARAEGFSHQAAANLQSAFFEMVENTQLHSQSAVSSLVGYQVTESVAHFSVCDVGVGILKSLRENAQYSHLDEDVEAIQLALKTGVTCRKDEYGGFGFNSVFKALAEQWGELRFRSGNGCITMDGTSPRSDNCRRYRPIPMPGFQVNICCRTLGTACNGSAF